MRSAGLTAGRPGRPQKAVSDELDETLLDRAIQAMRDAEFADISLERVAARIGVSRPTLYRRFKNRDALIDAMVQREFSTLFELGSTSGDPSDDPVAALRNQARQLFTVLVRPSTVNFVRLLIQEAANIPGLARSRREWHLAVLGRLLPNIQRAVDVGLFAAQPADRLAHLLIGLLDSPVGLVTMGFSADEALTGLTEDEFFNWRFGIFLRAAQPAPGSPADASASARTVATTG